MKTIRLRVENNVLSLSPDQTVKQIVCGNEGYKIEVDFDNDWEGFANKKARFICNGIPEDKGFTGNVCNVPKLSNVSTVTIGIFAEDDEAATTFIVYPCEPSILCIETKKEEEPKALEIDGTWVFKDDITADTNITFEGDFRCSGGGWSGYGTGIVVKVGEREPGWSFTEIDYRWTDMEPNDSQITVYNTDAGGWNEGEYGDCKTITFTGTQTVSEAFMNFMNTNATKQ